MKKNHEAQFLENKTLKLKNKYIKKIKIKITIKIMRVKIKELSKNKQKH